MNYAFPGSGYNQSPFQTSLPQMSHSSQIMFDQDPAAAYEYMLSWLRPSATDDSALRRLYNVMQTRYNSMKAEAGANVGSDTRWMDWLGQQDFNRELARMPRETRGDASMRFGRPARFINF